jgi:hypothetical protein
VDNYKINNTTKISRKILNYMITKSYHKMQKNSRKIANLRYIKDKQAGRTYHTQHKVHHTPLQATFRLLPNNNMASNKPTNDKNRERRMKRRLKQCNEYYLPEDRYTWRKIDGKNYIQDREGNLYPDIEDAIKDIEKTIGLC